MFCHIKNVKFWENKVFDHFTNVGIVLVHAWSDVAVDTLSKRFFSVRNLSNVVSLLHVVIIIIIGCCLNYDFEDYD